MDKTRRKIKPIARKRRNFLYLFLGILFLIITGYIFFSYPPEQKFKILVLEIPILPLFLFSLFISTYSVMRFIFIYSSQALLISLIFLSYLIFRLFGLTHWIFALLFISLFIVIEFLIAKKK